MEYIILITITLILSIITYKLFNKDILSPSFIVCVTYFTSALSAFLSKIFNLWNNIELNWFIILIIITGLLSFILGEFITRRVILTIKKRRKIKSEKVNKQLIKISNIKLIIIYLFLIMTFVVIFYQMVEITGINNNIPKMINAYRAKTPLFNNTDATSISTFAMQMYRASELFAYIFIFICINNLLLKDKIKNNIKYIFLIFIPILTSLLISGRTLVFKLVVATIFIAIILYRKIYSRKFKFRTMITTGIIVAIIILPIFYLIMPLIGRKQGADIISYISFYIGSPIPSFNEIMERGELGNNEHFGEETFKGIQSFLNRFELIDYYEPYQKQWINYKELSSNTFTGLKNYYSDFGISGVVICQLLFASLVVVLYNNAKHKNGRAYIIFFMFSATYMIFDQYRVEKLFSSFITLDTVIYVVYMFIILAFLFKDKEDLEKLIKRRK